MKSLFQFLRKNRALTFWLLFVWTLIIFVGCFIPSSELPKVKIVMIDKWVHFVFFAGFSFLLMCYMRKVQTFHFFLAFFLAVLLGYLVELIQDSGLVKGRYFEWEDVLADGIGGFIGVLLFYLLEKKYSLDKVR